MCIRDRIEAIDQVLTTELSGAPEELLEATVNKSKLESYNISLKELYSAILILLSQEVHKIQVMVDLILKYLVFLKMQLTCITFL